MAGSTAMTFKLFGHDVSAGRTFREVGKTAAGVASGMGAAFAASKIKDWAKDSLTAFDSAGKASLKLQRYMGGSIEDASRLAHAFRMTGIDSDKSARALGIFSKAISTGALQQAKFGDGLEAVRNGTSKTMPKLGEMAKKFEEIGVSTVDAKGKTRDMKDVLMDVADKFKNMPAGADRTALALKLFGKAGAEMIPFLTKGRDGIAELMKQSDLLGTTMSGKDGQAVKDYTKAQREFKEMIYGVQISLGRALYPTLTKLGTTLLPMLLPKVQEFTTQMGKLPALIEQKWPIIKDKIKAIFDELGKVERKVKDNWPAIKDTFTRIGDALKRVGEWTRYLWDRFQSLPAPVKELIAMLAIAQKTGVLSIAFKGLDLAKNLIARIAGMSIQAATVIVNGAAGAGTAATGAGATAATAGKGAGAIAATLGKLGGWAAAAYVLYLSLNNAWDVLTQKKSAGDGLFYALTRFVPEGNVLHSVVKTWGGIWDWVTGKAQRTSEAMRGLHWWDGVLTVGQARLAAQVGNTNLKMVDRFNALSKLRDIGAIEIQSLRDQGASQEAIEQKTIKWKDAIQKAGEKLGWTQAQIDAYKGKLDSIPYGKETIIRARTGDASRSVLGLASTINGVVHPPPIKIRADGTEVHGPIADVGAAIGNLLNPPPIKITAKSEVHGPVADAGGAVGRLLHPPPIRITAKSEVHGPVADVGASIGRLLHPPPIKITADGSQAMQVVQSVGAAVGAALGALSALTRRPRTQQWKPPRGAPPGVYVPRQFASGGIVTRATMGIVGEAGPEAVIPLSRARGALGGSPEVHIHVSGSVFATKEQMAREVVAALQNAKNRGLQLNLAG